MYFFNGRRSLRQVLDWRVFRQILCFFILSSLSSQITAQVVGPGGLAITQPRDGATFKSERPVELAARVIGRYFAILRVDYYDGGNRIASSRSPDFRAVWQRPPIGQHTITAAAITADGATFYSRFINITIVPSNDDFAGATALSGHDIFIIGNNTGATSEEGEPIHAGVGNGHSVWWKWKAPASCDVTIDPRHQTQSLQVGSLHRKNCSRKSLCRYPPVRAAR